MKKSLIKNEDKFIDSRLRPSKWSDYIGQEKIKNNLKVILTAAKKRKEPSDHLLFYGQAGLGKTTLAYLTAEEMGVDLKITTGPAIEKAGDLASILSNLEENDILFIDEAHRLNKAVEEILYPAMDSRKIHIIIGKELGARTISLDIPPFTLIAATTRPNLLSYPLRSRFGGVFRLDYYDIDDIKKIIERAAEIMGIIIEESAAELLSRASRFTPRIANRLLKRARDFAEVKNLKIINKEIIYEVLKMWEIDELGLESGERKLLEIIIKRFNNRPTGIKTLAAALNEDRGVVEEIYEPYLIRLGLIERTPSGRKAADHAYNHLNIFNGN